MNDFDEILKFISRKISENCYWIKKLKITKFYFGKKTSFDWNKEIMLTTEAKQQGSSTNFLTKSSANPKISFIWTQFIDSQMTILLRSRINLTKQTLRYQRVKRIKARSWIISEVKLNIIKLFSSFSQILKWKDEEW